MGSLYMIVGPSGTGKSTLEANLVRNLPAMHRARSHTTRAPREDEQQGVDYHYIDKSQFRRLEAQGFFVESVEYDGNYYGISHKEIDDHLRDGDVVIVVEGHGAEQLKTAYPNSLWIFLRPPAREELVRRLTERGDAPDKVARRVDEQHVANEMTFAPQADIQLEPMNEAELFKVVRSLVMVQRARAGQLKSAAHDVPRKPGDCYYC